MNQNRNTNWTGGARAALALAALSVAWALPAEAQSPNAQTAEIQQLKQRLRQVEQMMKDIQSQLRALETAQTAPAPATVAAAAPKPATAAAATATAQPPHPVFQGKQPEKEPANSVEIYGFAMLDSGYDFKTNNPDWFDVVRPTKLPANAGEYAPDGKVYFSVRQSRFGVKTANATPLGNLKTIFEFELYGTGVDAGQTTFRLRQAYGELGHFGGGQTVSPFMDPDVFPNSLEYWGPNGMVFFRNVQFRWMPIQGESRVTFAVERPGATADQGVYSDRIELEGVKPKFDVPSFTGEGRLARKWGYVRLAGLIGRTAWVDTNRTPTRDLSGSAVTWGLNLSSNLKLGKKNTAKLQAAYGHGVENWMNDAPVDIGIQNNFSNRVAPIKGVALPVLGIVAFLDHNWSSRLTTSIGYSMLNIWNSDAQAANAFHQGQYALVNLLFNPVKDFMFGGEFQFGRRLNYLDGFNANDYRLQFSVRYNHSALLTY